VSPRGKRRNQLVMKTKDEAQPIAEVPRAGVNDCQEKNSLAK
jgi:hypothetical protein